MRSTKCLPKKGIALPLESGQTVTEESRLPDGIAAQGGCEPQVKDHAGGNAAVGNGKGTLLAVLTVCLPYIGFPRTINALGCINAVLPETEV